MQRQHKALHSFLRRVLLVFVLASIVCVSITYVVIEQYLSQQIHQKLEKEKTSYLQKLPEIDGRSQQVVATLKSYADTHNALYIKVTDQNNQNSAHYQAPGLSATLLQEIDLYRQNTELHQIIYQQHQYYLFFQEPLTDSEHNYSVTILFQLDPQSVFLLESNSLNSILVVALTLMLVLVTAFPLIYRQYKSILDKDAKLIESNIETIQALGNAIAKRDSDTHSHNYRVAYYSIRLAEALVLEPSLIEEIIKGAFLHDVGKIAISDNILLKPGKLTPEEFSIMQSHSAEGLYIVKDISWLHEARNVILYHHEKFDGSGYPEGLSAQAIPLEARLFAIADVFDALSSPRPYKQAIAADKCMEIMQAQSGKHFDPELLQAFIHIYQDCYQQVANSQGTELEQKLRDCITPYFTT